MNVKAIYAVLGILGVTTAVLWAIGPPFNHADNSQRLRKCECAIAADDPHNCHCLDCLCTSVAPRQCSDHPATTYVGWVDVQDGCVAESSVPEVGP